MRELNKLNDFKLMLPKINKRFIVLTAIFVAGSILATAYASNTVIDNTSVSTTTVNTVDLHVTGTCTGCGGGASEGSFTNWTTVTNSSVATSGVLNGGEICKADEHGNTLYYDSDGEIILMDATPTKLTEISIGSGSLVQPFDQSVAGKYQVIQSSTNNYAIYSNAVLIKTVGVTSSNFSGLHTVCMSPDGKYIAILGRASANHERVVILQGS